MSNGVKLDIELNWITNTGALQKEVLSMNKRISRIAKVFNKDYLNLLPVQKINAETYALKRFDETFLKIFSDLEKQNKKGGLSYLLGTMFERDRINQKALRPAQLTQLATMKTWEELDRQERQQKHDEMMAKKTAELDAKMKSQLEKEKERRYQANMRSFLAGSKERFKEELGIKTGKEKLLSSLEKSKHKTWQDIFMGSVAGLTSRNPIFDKMKSFYIQQDKNAKAEAKRIETNKREEEKLRKKEWMLLLGKWGRFGVWGIAAQQAIKYISRAIGFAYSTSMQGLDWQRTISGGASGGSWFGKGLAAYQRAGIGANQYQSFKRGLQGYIGSVKLGMGNAAPLMYLGLSALGNPDELERQLERSLRRLPKDVSLALAGQMGLDYNMWETIYSGRLDRTKSAYSEEAIQKWKEVADKLNDILTTLKVFGFENIGNIAYNLMHPTESIKQSSWIDKISWGLGMMHPALRSFIRFSPIDVIVRNEKGEVIGKGQAQPDYNSDMFEWGNE